MPDDALTTRTFGFPYGEHFTAVGTTGCGKTMMVKHAILSRHYRFIILDSKARLDGSSLDFTEPAFVKADVPSAIRIASGTNPRAGRWSRQSSPSSSRPSP